MKSQKEKEKVNLLRQYQGTKAEQLMRLKQEWSGCRKCMLGDMREAEAPGIATYYGDKVDVLFGDGNPDADIVIVGEAPGEEETLHGIPFIGPSGKLLNQLLARTSGDPEIKKLLKEYNSERRHTEQSTNDFTVSMVEWRQKNFFITNAVGCRPPENRTPIPPEVEACWDRLWNIIYIVDPVLIIACGNSALAALSRKRVAKITKERGAVYDMTYEGRIGPVTYPVVPIFHPSYLIRKADWNAKNGDWEKTVRDVQNALSYVDQVRHRHYGEPIPNREPYI